MSIDTTRVDPAKRPEDWSAAEVSFWPEDCAQTDACGHWVDKATGDLFVVLWHDTERDLLHGYRVWASPGEGCSEVEMWHCNGVQRLIDLYGPAPELTQQEH